jgi:hypothetical protein
MCIFPSSLHDHPAKFLKRYFANWQHVQVIQIGAHDGVAGDPIRPNAFGNGAWSGVPIEPKPTLFEQLKFNYAGQKGLQFKCAAVSATSGVLPVRPKRLSSFASLRNCDALIHEWSFQRRLHRADRLGT